MRPQSGASPRRVVVYTGGAEGLELPAAKPAPDDWILGGTRTLHELAFAAAATGRGVEMRGPVLPAAFESLSAATGLSPELADAPRRAAEGDVVLISEGDGVLYHEPHPLALLLKLRSMIADGGRLLLGTIMLADPDASEYMRFVPDAFGGDPSWRWVPGRLAVRWMLESCGFAEVEDLGVHPGPEGEFRS